MKAILVLFGLFLALAPAQAGCKDCGCKVKCSPSCECPREEKPKAQ